MRMTRLRNEIVPALLAVVVCSSLGCALREVSVEVGGTHLRSVAIANYERPGGVRLDRLLELLDSDPLPRIGEPADAASGDVAGDVPGAGSPEGAAAADEPGGDSQVQPVPVPQPEPVPPPEPGLGLELALMTEVDAADGRRVLAAVEDGDSLFDGFERLGDGDGLKLHLQVDAECTVYVIQLDASARPRALFPNTLWSTVGNPMQAGRPYRLPEGNVLFDLGPTRGIETLYVIASPEPWPELEALLAETESATWDRLATPATVQHASRIRRGVAAVYSSTAHAVGGPAGTLTDVPSTRYVGKLGARVVVTRWFRHR